jgi:hypothetical protein
MWNDVLGPNAIGHPSMGSGCIVVDPDRDLVFAVSSGGDQKIAADSFRQVFTAILANIRDVNPR